MHPQLLFAAAWMCLNLLLLLHPGVRYLASFNHDWQAWLKIRPLIEAGLLYDPAHWFVWSPVAMWTLAYVFVPLGYPLWVAIHLGVVPLIRDWWLVLLTIASVPFWVDTLGGNTFTFVFVAGVAALMGSRIGIGSSMLLFVLMPRPVVFPLIAWLLWKHQWSRWLLAGVGVATLAIAIVAGDLGGWVRNMVAIGQSNHDHFANLAPTKLLGPWWLLIGVPAAVWLTVRGRVGLAGLAMSPYALPGYLLVLLWEWVPSVRQRRQQASRT